MKVLVIDLCREENSLHYKEFVQPVVDILNQANIKNEIIYFKKLDVINFEDYNNFNKIILCGVALKDFDYLDNLDKFEILKKVPCEILGICAGSQIIGKLFGYELKKGQEIGLIDLDVLKNDKIFEDVNLNEVYCLHNSYIDFNESNFVDVEILAKSKNFVQAFKIRNFYGVLFHPEVRNKELIINFVQ